jgi:transposase
MMFIGVDYHPSFQTIAYFVEETGECGEQELNHSEGQAEKFYRDLKQRGICVRVGMEATGYARWFERLLAELGFELWIGDPAEIKAKRVKKQKFDREDARLLLRLLRENNFPQIWVPGPENRDLRQLLWHRHRLVQMRTRIMNQLHALAMNEGYRWKKKLFSEPWRAQLEKLALAPWASRRRRELLELLDRMNPTIEELTAAVEREARKRPEAMRLTTHPGVGPLTALAYVLIIGTPTRFQCGKQLGTYVGMIRVRSPVLASSDWGISANKEIPCCASCWWKQPKQRHAFIRTGDVGTCTWRCVDTKALPRWRWAAGWRFACTGCGGMVVSIRSL